MELVLNKQSCNHLCVVRVNRGREKRRGVGKEESPPVVSLGGPRQEIEQVYDESHP